MGSVDRLCQSVLDVRISCMRLIAAWKGESYGVRYKRI